MVATLQNTLREEGAARSTHKTLMGAARSTQSHIRAVLETLMRGLAYTWEYFVLTVEWESHGSLSIAFSDSANGSKSSTLHPV